MRDQDEILTIPELAALLKVASKTVYALAQRGELSAFKALAAGKSRTRVREDCEVSP